MTDVMSEWTTAPRFPRITRHEATNLTAWSKESSLPLRRLPRALITWLSREKRCALLWRDSKFAGHPLHTAGRVSTQAKNCMSVI